MAVFDALIQLMENLTVPVECPQLRACLVRTKESFRDPRTTTVILAWVERLIREGLNEKIYGISINFSAGQRKTHVSKL